MESFFTIQGEGYNTGKPAFFIRTGGCDVGCHWCDVKDSWDALQHPEKTVIELVDEVVASNGTHCVVTGGEPLMHDLSQLTRELKNNNISCWLETSGSYPISGEWDWICLSPKKMKNPLPEVLKLSHELKIVIYNMDDFKWAEEHANSVNTICKLYLQPEWSVMQKMMPHIVDYVKRNPKWSISLQTHKFMNIP